MNINIWYTYDRQHIFPLLSYFDTSLMRSIAIVEEIFEPGEYIGKNLEFWAEK